MDIGKELAKAYEDGYEQGKKDAVWHGKWKGWHGDKLVGVTDDDKDVYRHYHYYECSECYRKTAVKSNYCPNCGAKMED